MTLRIIAFFILIDVIIDAQVTNCPKKDIRFEKVLGLRPSSQSHPAVLYKSGRNETGVITKCIHKCQLQDDCISFVVFYNTSTCFSFKNAIHGVQELENELDTNTAWFTKVCYRAQECKKLWVFERVPGATLVGNNTKILPKTYTRTECQINCLNEKDFMCRSVKFKIKESNYGPNDEIKGICILSEANRHIIPSAFRASAFDDEYFENQCLEENYDIEGEFCTYEEYDNVTLMHVDIDYKNKTKEDCQELCENTDVFNCRGYSLVENDTQFNCYLHSEDTKLYGPKLLEENIGSKYFERTPCLNISISCTETYMTVKYSPNTKFMGRIYMDGYSEQLECSAKGTGIKPVVLKLSLLTEQCGIIKAISPDDRTLKAGTMILQYNPFVQTQGDRVIRVGCVYGNDSKVLAGTGITITTTPNHASPLINTTGAVGAPGVEMRVIDLYSQQEVSSTQIGQELQLIIEMKNSDGSLDIWAGHLIAMTADGSESILLLDDRGCPTNLNIFPALTKIHTNDSILLVGNFQAFKFSSSPIVRFSVIVQFCPKNCLPINCGNEGRVSFNVKREVAPRTIQTIDGTKIMNVSRSDFESEMKMPLEFIMIVRKSQANSERLVLSDGKILIAGYDFIQNEVCLDYSLFIGLIITWVIIQIIFVVCCLVLVRRYKKYYEQESLTQSLEQLNKNFGIGFSNLDRRVHWADHEEYT